MSPTKTEVKPVDSALGDAISDIEKKYGKGAVMKLGDAKHVDIEIIPTGSLTLDLALGPTW
jgi:recombination protein RecA